MNEHQKEKKDYQWPAHWPVVSRMADISLLPNFFNESLIDFKQIEIDILKQPTMTGYFR
jgi:hypothetical protein